jgi:hypothetical protein
MLLTSQRLLYLFLMISVLSCAEKQIKSSIPGNDFEFRKVRNLERDSLESGTTYLSVYSQIYGLTQSRIHDLTVIASLRNMNLTDSVYIQTADLYDTHGELIKSYVREDIFIGPMETLEIVIEENDPSGGTGANFIFEWKKPAASLDPYFEGIMISTSGQQGLSFATRGIRID